MLQSIRRNQIAIGFFTLALGIAFGFYSLGFGSVLVAAETWSFYSGQLPIGTAALLGLLLGSLVLALTRRGKIAKLQSLVMDKQAREIYFQDRALNAHAIVSITDPDSNILSVNDNFLKTFEYEREEIIGQTHELIHPSPYSGAVSVFNDIFEAVKQNKVWSGEHKAITKSGKTLFMQCTVVPLHDENGHHVKNVSMRTDVTETRLAEADRYLTSMLDKLQDEVYIYNTDDLRISYMNETALNRCEWTLKLARTKLITHTASNFEEGLFRKHVEPLFNGEKESVVVETLHDKGFVEINTRLYVGPDDIPVFVSVLRDITERKEVDRARMESVSVVSHELRTPLTSIKGALRLLQSGAAGVLEPGAAAIVDVADRNSERLLKVVNDILDFEKIRAGKMDINKRPVKLSDFIMDATTMNKGYGDEHQVKFVATGIENDAFVSGDSDRLMQVISNLMSNAVKYSPKNGTVVVNLKDMGRKWRISVSDSGPGIPESARASMFDSFVQSDPVDGIIRKGTGLGLPIAKEIVERHSGKIDFESTVGKGSTFYFELPKVESPELENPKDRTQLAAE